MTSANCKSLRVCCYGSSSPKTPQKYLDEAYRVGYLLGSRGHICVNGAGASGCMNSMNDGAADANGHIVGVIHEKFVVDGQDWMSNNGAHEVFSNANANANGSTENGPHREIVIAGGDDLQERKRLLVKDADALLVLPGGPGTFDEVRTTTQQWISSCFFRALCTKTFFSTNFQPFHPTALGNGLCSQPRNDEPSNCLRQRGWLLRSFSADAPEIIH